MKRQSPTTEYGIHKKYLIPDNLWEEVKLLLPQEKPKKKMGRPRMDDRQAMTAIFYVLRTGIQWNALPRSLGASSTVHDRFCEWTEEGVFERIWQVGLAKYDKKNGLDWEWQSMDGAITKAPLGKKRMYLCWS
jgi:putative transposase